MKKILSVILSAVLILGAIALTSSCKKDTLSTSLKGSTWICQDFTGTYTLTFPSANEFKITIEGNDFVAVGAFGISGNKTSLKGSTITFTLAPNTYWIDGETNAITGTFESESKLVIESEDMVFLRSLK